MSEQNFKSWLNLVNKHIYSKLQIHLEDLPDNSFRLDFEQGLTPHEMALKTVKDTEWEEYYVSLLKKNN